MKILATVLARGGSKGLPGKNIKSLLGKPLLAYTIEEAKKSKYINKIVLSTDYEDIAEVGRQYGAEVPFMRPAELAGDNVMDQPVIKHALDWLRENENYVPDIIVHLVPTAPLRKAEHIDKGVEIFLEHPDADSVRSVVESPKHPLKCWSLENQILKTFIPKNIYGFEEPYSMPRQKLPRAYVNNGSVYVIKPSVILEKNSMAGDKIYGFEMPAENSINIDDKFDFMMAEMIIKKEREKSIPEVLLKSEQIEKFVSNLGDNPFGEQLLKNSHKSVIVFRLLTSDEMSPKAEIHENYTDIFLVKEGEEEFFIGGEIVDKESVDDGEWSGSNLVGARKYNIKAGDVVIIPKGVPHRHGVGQIKMMVVKVR